jgi:hemerythrin-like domain-containing protein
MPQGASQPGCDTHEMVVVHRVFRREFDLLPRMVRAVPAGDRERVAIVAAHAGELLVALQHHHEGEDALVWPKLHARAEVPQALIYLMESQHAAVAEFMQAAGPLIHQWSATGSERARDELALVLDNLSAVLNEHLDDEERSVLPIVARTLTPAEWQTVGDRGMAGIPKPRLLIFLGALLEDATDEERTAFLKKVPLAGRLMYRFVGVRRYDRHRALLRRDLVGVPSATASPG